MSFTFKAQRLTTLELSFVYLGSKAIYFISYGMLQNLCSPPHKQSFISQFNSNII